MHIAIVGSGQLSRMMALAGIPLGFTFSFVAEESENTSCVEGLGKIVIKKAEQSAKQIIEALGLPDLITVEKEQVDVDFLKSLQEFCPVHPSTEAFSVCQHRNREKQVLAELGIPCSAHTYRESAAASVEKLSLPMLAKSCSEGYDGKNQWVLKTQEDIEAYDKEHVGEEHIIEQWVPFEKEVSQVSVRRANGEIAHYPLTENQHQSGILRRSFAPALNMSPAMIELAQDMITKLMTRLNYVGVMAMECFVVGDGLLVNELAPRVHNSGHWTQNGSITSQFENHIRAIADFPIGDVKNHSVSGMVNLIGVEKPSLSFLTPRSSMHWYDKSVRSGRKLGHVNFTADDMESLQKEMEKYEQSVITCA